MTIEKDVPRNIRGLIRAEPEMTVAMPSREQMKAALEHTIEGKTERTQQITRDFTHSVADRVISPTRLAIKWNQAVDQNQPYLHRDVRSHSEVHAVLPEILREVLPKSRHDVATQVTEQNDRLQSKRAVKKGHKIKPDHSGFGEDWSPFSRA